MKKSFARTFVAAVGVAGLFSAGQAASAERGFYVGVFYGQADKASEQSPYDALANRNYDNFGFEPQQATTSFDTKDSSFGFLGGYRLFEHLAIEGGYFDLGEVAYRNNSTGIDHTADEFDDNGAVDHSGDVAGNWNQQIRAKSKGMTLTALGILPLSYRSEIFVRGGIMFSSSKLDIHLSNGVDEASNNPEQQTSTDLLAGVGASFTFADIYTFRLEYQRIFDEGDKSTDERDVDLMGISVTVTF